jgi:hypothetical protein
MTMSVPQEQTIIDTIADWLREITWANGYRTNAGHTVYVDENDIPDVPTSDLLLVLDHGSEAIDNGRWNLTVLIEGLIVLTAVDMPSVARNLARLLMADVRDAVKKGRIRTLLPAGVTELKEVSRVIPRREPGSNMLVVVVTLQIHYSDLFLEV